VLPFLGVANEFGLFPSLISPWMDNGNILPLFGGSSDDITYIGSILNYLHKNPDVKRKPLLVGIAKGLEYLHGKLLHIGVRFIQNRYLTVSKDYHLR